MDLNKYQIPIKIENDGLKDTIVVVKFHTDYNLSKLESLVKSYLDSLQERNFEKIETRKVDLEIEDSPDQNSSFFYSDGQYKVIVKTNQIAFNCVSKYTGWNNYFTFILGCLEYIGEYILGSNIIVRYISSYPELSLAAFLDGTIEYKCFGNTIRDQVHTIRCNLIKENGLPYGIGIIRLFDSVNFQQQKQSIVDIEIQSTDFSPINNNFRAIIDFIIDGHIFEKKIFYSLLKKEFIDTKSPTYA